MSNAKMLVSAIVLASAMLAGCSNTETTTAPSNNELAAINAKLSQIQNDVQEARAEAIRANQRLDNLSGGYKK